MTEGAGRTSAAAAALCVIAFVAGTSLTLLACGESDADRSARWQEALAHWDESHDPSSHPEWSALDERTPEGAEAHRRLREADRHYRRGISLVEAGDPGAREAFREAVSIAPMDPRLYLPLARAFRGQAELQPDNPHLFIRAAEYYRKFLALTPDDPRVADARRELDELDPSATQFLEPTSTTARADDDARSQLGVASALTLASLALALATLFLLVRRRGPTRSLAEMATQRPELHPAIAYLVATIRHELLKHRIGAVSSGVRSLASARGPRDDKRDAQRAFVAERLFGGEPLLLAWESHLGAFERALGPELDVRRRDVAFREAGRAMRAIARLEAGIRRGDASALSALARHEATLRALDGSLAHLVAGLVRTRLDAVLVREVLDAVRSEIAAGEVKLDGVAIDVPDPAPFVEVFRADLVLVLKNVVRNAVLAVGRAEAPRRIGIEVQVELLPTGEENVALRVLDSSPEVLTTEAIAERRVDRGLGLVTAALTRYDGAILVEDAAPPYRKAICIRFFRAFDREVG
ncbi:MAG: hypothetical protein J0L92_33060 [Deltaproteobacteria bacterium]|nr:hypothetical protein [Deltaproteobacteria bacterium]